MYRLLEQITWGHTIFQNNRKVIKESNYSDSSAGWLVQVLESQNMNRSRRVCRNNGARNTLSKATINLKVELYKQIKMAIA